MNDLEAYFRNKAKRLNTKRWIDITLSAVALVLLAPVGLTVAVIVLVDGGDILFAHERVGVNGRPFRCLKFRSMRRNSEQLLRDLLATDETASAEWHEHYKLKNDPRITWYGDFIRRSSIDELPQLFNVLKGDMSLVGPRPVMEEELQRYGKHVDELLSVPPGLTGLWQVSGRNDLDYEQRVALDVEYVRTHNRLLDFKILIKTVLVVLGQKGAY